MRGPYGRFAFYKILLLEIAVVYFEIANGFFPKFAFVYSEIAIFRFNLQLNKKASQGMSNYLRSTT